MKALISAAGRLLLRNMKTSSLSPLKSTWKCVWAHQEQMCWKLKEDKKI